MSGVLDRMAKRALGALDGVQPLLAPRFAPLPGETGASSVAPEIALETDTPSPAREGAAGDAARIDGSTPATESAPRQRLPAMSILPIAGRSSSDLSPRPSRPIESGTGAAAVTTPDQLSRMPAAEATPAQGDIAASSHTALPGTAHSIEGPQREPDAKPAMASAPPGQIVPRSSDMVEAGREANEIVSTNPSPAGGVPPVRISSRELPKSLQPSSPRTPAVPPPPAAPVSDQKTEIHITIGSIELRAPRTEAKAPAAPFRPRVTLNDFLRRGQEGRS